MAVRVAAMMAVLVSSRCRESSVLVSSSRELVSRVRAEGLKSCKIAAMPGAGNHAIRQRQAGEQPRRGRARRSRADGTISGLAVGRGD